MQSSVFEELKNNIKVVELSIYTMKISINDFVLMILIWVLSIKYVVAQLSDRQG